MALSPDAFTIAVSSYSNLSFFDALTGERDQVVENICNGNQNNFRY